MANPSSRQGLIDYALRALGDPVIEINIDENQIEELKKKADAAGVPNICYYGKNPIIFRDPSNEKQVDFLIRKVNE